MTLELQKKVTIMLKIPCKKKPINLSSIGGVDYNGIAHVNILFADCMVEQWEVIQKCANNVIAQSSLTLRILILMKFGIDIKDVYYTQNNLNECVI